MTPRELTLNMVIFGQAESKEEAAFEQLIRQHEHRVLNTALRLLGRLEDAQDAAQEVFLRLHKYRHRFDQRRELAPWLYRMTVNVCYDILRRQREVPLPKPAEYIAETPDPNVEMDRAVQRRLLHKALRKLPEKQRAAIVLRDIEGLSTQQVAKILDSSETTVRSQISTGRLRLKELIGRSR